MSVDPSGRPTVPRAGESWGAYGVSVPDEWVDELAGRLGADSLGVEIRSEGGGRSVLWIYLSTPSEARRASEELERLLAAEGGAEARRWRLRGVATVEDGHWVERYQSSLRPFRLGERFVVEPGGDGATLPGLTPIRLVPGRAFGTGEHPTTRLCATALERWLRGGDRWLDLGTGSGILAVVACHCGAARVDAVDIDPLAVEVARKVIRENDLETRAVAAVGEADCFAGSRLDGVVANISAGLFLSDGSRIAATLREGGLLVASGFSEDESREVARVLGRSGLSEIERLVDRGWGCLVMRLEQAKEVS